MTSPAQTTNPAISHQRQAVVIQHVSFEDLGTLEPALAAEGFEIEVLQAGVTDLSSLADRVPELLIVLGGPIGVYEQAAYPWLRDEIELLARRLTRKQPTLGICLGAQLMAAALGSRVYPGEHGKEIGWGPILTVRGTREMSPLVPLFDHRIQVLHWHGDTFDLPDRATHLAASDRYPNQAFSVGEQALALQFHAEVKASRLERWYIGHAVQLSHAGISVPELRAQSRTHGPRLEHAARDLWRRWLRQICKYA